MSGTPHEDPRVLELITAPLDAQLETLASWGMPAAGLLLLMNACENRCFFCANDGVMRPRPETITRWERVERWLEQNRTLSAKTLCVIGTEPALHADFERALRLAGDVGFGHIEVLTSGLRLAELGAASRWRALGVGRVCVPLYAAEAPLHDEVVGVPAFERTLRGLDAARRAGIEVRVHTLALVRTLRALPALARLVRERFGTRLSVAPLRPKEALFDYAREAPTLEAVETAVRELDVGLVGFPLCVAPRHPRDAALAMQLYFRGQVTSFTPDCDACAQRPHCLGVVSAEVPRARLRPSPALHTSR